MASSFLHSTHTHITAPSRIVHLLIIIFISLFSSASCSIVSSSFLITYSADVSLLQILSSGLTSSCSVSMNSSHIHVLPLDSNIVTSKYHLSQFPFTLTSFSALPASSSSYYVSQTFDGSSQNSYRVVDSQRSITAATGTNFYPAFHFSSPNINCNAHTLQDNNTFNCSSTTTSPSEPFQMTTLSQLPSNYSILLELNQSVTDVPTFVDDALALGIHHVLQQSRLQQSTAYLSNLFSERRNSARIAVGFLWTFILFATIFMFTLLSIWVQWFLPIFKYAWILPLCSLMTFMLVTGLIIWRWGLFGYILVLVVTVTLIILCCCVYLYLRIKRRAVEEDYERMARVEVGNDSKPTLSHAQSVDLLRQSSIAQTKHELLYKPQDDYADVEQQPLNLDMLDTGTLTPYSPTDMSKPAMGYRVFLKHYLMPLNSFPFFFGHQQLRAIKYSLLGFMMCVVICIAILGLWSVNNYYVYERHTTGASLEIIPATLAKAIFLVYAFDGYATTLKMNNVLFDVSTEWCGKFYTQLLTTDQDKKDMIYTQFIERYQVDMSIYNETSYLKYDSVNAWFIRTLRPGARPITSPYDSRIIVSPTDCRLMLFPTLEIDSRIWIKESSFNSLDLVGGNDARWVGGSMVLARLAPQDYHRFHAPTPGTITALYKLEGTKHSVGVDGMTSSNYAIYNQRTVIIYSSPVGNVAYIAIGALCVGSVSLNYRVGDSFNKGDELGYFQFGGSTVVVLFEAGRVRFDLDVLMHSQQRVESLVLMGNRIAEAIP